MVEWLRRPASSCLGLPLDLNRREAEDVIGDSERQITLFNESKKQDTCERNRREAAISKAGIGEG